MFLFYWLSNNKVIKSEEKKLQNYDIAGCDPWFCAAAEIKMRLEFRVNMQT
jgi:hypothetical protein